jgi:hypothetical protein
LNGKLLKIIEKCLHVNGMNGIDALYMATVVSIKQSFQYMEFMFDVYAL